MINDQCSMIIERYTLIIRAAAHVVNVAGIATDF